MTNWLKKFSKIEVKVVKAYLKHLNKCSDCKLIDEDDHYELRASCLVGRAIVNDYNLIEEKLEELRK